MDYSKFATTSQELARGQNDQMAQQQPQKAMLDVDTQRSIAEVKAALAIAQGCPRPEHQAIQKIKKACRRPKMAEQAMYVYNRGGAPVTGPSIRLAEVCAQCWGNIQWGFRELSRTDGVSECEAFAWDLETNAKQVRTFQVRHLRDKRGGAVAITAERDIYEAIASSAQRRVRECLWGVIPRDVIEEAVETCQETLRSASGATLDERRRKMVDKFSELGVTIPMLEEHIQHGIDTLDANEITNMITIYRTIKDGMADRKEYFNLNAGMKKGAANDGPDGEGSSE